MNNLFSIVQELLNLELLQHLRYSFSCPLTRQLSTKSYLLLPNGLCTLKMLGGCLSTPS